MLVTASTYRRMTSRQYHCLKLDNDEVFDLTVSEDGTIPLQSVQDFEETAIGLKYRYISDIHLIFNYVHVLTG